MANSGGKLRWIAGATLLVVLALAIAWFAGGYGLPASDPTLTRFVYSPPPCPIVFTSRSSAPSLRAAADEGETFTYPGQPLWQAKQGRLRMLLPNGKVSELTWGKSLPDGSTLIDAMSPSVSPDGHRIVFAGRSSSIAAGHFRLYSINTDGTELRQLTGTPGDKGCTTAPPMRFAEDGKTILSDDVREQIDYDDVDPVYAPGGHIIFASSRTPDLGRDHSRRSTTLWIMREDGSQKRPLSANRNNDRWPWIVSSGYVIFSLWSRNREVISADETKLEPYQDGTTTATLPTDNWLGAHIEPNGDFFGSVLKTRQPVWRPRQLLDGKYAFMTPLKAVDSSFTGEDILTVVEAMPGAIANAPSSLAMGSKLPLTSDTILVAAPSQDANGKPLQLACPSPCPPDKIVLAGSTPDDNGKWDDHRLGIYIANDRWPTGATAESIQLTELFDDPQFADAEPVAVYPREINYEYRALEIGDGNASITFKNNETYTGPSATIHSSSVLRKNNYDAPGQKAEAGTSPIFNAPPKDLIETIRIYASHRDRFDSPDKPRVPGGFELLLEVPIQGDDVEFKLPPGSPTVLAGFDSKGHVASWQGTAATKDGTHPKFYAIAGDHYSGARPGFTHSCTGCHTGHSGTPTLQLKPSK
ncbi:hypothetical protein GC197_11810 [bacterium]|nr:hypothetical protein [bacterium]